MVDLSDFGARTAGASLTKTAELFGVTRSNESIWERRKNFLTDAKLYKKAKAVR